MSKMINYSILNDFSLEIENAYLRLLLTVIDESSCIGRICKAKSQKSSGHAMRFILLCFHDKECWMTNVWSTVTRKHFIPRIFPSKSGGIKESSQNARRPSQASTLELCALQIKSLLARQSSGAPDLGGDCDGARGCQLGWDICE